MNIKKELIVGIVGSILVFAMIFFYSNQYKSNIPNLTRSIANTNSLSSPITLTASEVAKHNSASDCWIIIQGSIYNVTQYLNIHPGGSDRIAPFCGQDATSAFVTQGGKGSHSSQASLDLSKLKLGQLNDTINIINTNNQIKNDVSLIKSSGKNKENDDDD
jgi:cytochrome b involved in lipid metabolism